MKFALVCCDETASELTPSAMNQIAHVGSVVMLQQQNGEEGFRFDSTNISQSVIIDFTKCDSGQ